MDIIEGTVDGRTLRHQHRRPTLLHGAVEYILDHGVAELRLRPLADALGVTHATLLRHFGSKEALVLEVLAHIRDGLFAAAPTTSASASHGVDPADAMRAAWRRLRSPEERRQFILLFELTALHARDPGRLGPLAQALIDDFLAPMESTLRAAGYSPSRARDVATSLLAQVRGLQLDLALANDIRRVDAAMERYIEAITATP